MHSKQRGSAAVEFVVMLGPLLLMLFGIMEVSRLFLTVGVVADAAREGARTGAVTAPSGGVLPDGEARVLSVLTAANLSATTNSVKCSPDASCPAGSTVTATVAVAFKTPIPLLVPLFGSSYTVQRTTTMRYE